MAGEVRKTIGEEGSRKQTVFVFFTLLFLGLIFYLPAEWRNRPKKSITIVSKKASGNIIQIVKKKVDKPDQAATETAIKNLLDGLSGQYGVWAGQSATAAAIGFNSDRVFTAASVIKLPVLVVYYQAVDSGRIDPGEIYSLKETDRWRYGTGSMQNQPAGTKYSYRQVAQLTANQSDNMGAEILIKKLGGYGAVQKEIDKLKLKQTDLHENETSPQDIGQLFLELAKGRLLKASSREELFKNLTNTLNEDRLPAGVAEGVTVVHKFGSEAGVVNDCGLVEASNPYVICVLTTDVNDGEAEAVLPKISAAVWQWLGD